VLQQLFRSQQQQTTTPQQIQLLQQQQYLATQQQQQQLAGLTATAAPFASAPYLINAQEPYVGTLITGPAVVPQAYYGMGPWVYPANIIQQGATGAPQRRPLTPSSSTELNNSTTNLTQVSPSEWNLSLLGYSASPTLLSWKIRDNPFLLRKCVEVHSFSCFVFIFLESFFLTFLPVVRPPSTF